MFCQYKQAVHHPKNPDGHPIKSVHANIFILKSD